MGSFYDEIPEHIIEWIRKQHIFFVASRAAGDGKAFANVSPKDMRSFTVEGPRRVWYQDATGSGVETISHMNQPGNNQLTIMFVAFEGAPRILRLFGKAKIHERTTPSFEEFLPPGDERLRPGCRAVIELEITRVGSSCGFSVPFFQYLSERPTLDNWAKKKISADLDLPLASVTTSPEGTLPSSIETELEELVRADAEPSAEGLRAYWRLKNARSVDGLPGLKALVSGKEPVEVEGKRRVPDVLVNDRTVLRGVKSVRKDHLKLTDWFGMLAILVLGIALGYGGRGMVGARC